MSKQRRQVTADETLSHKFQTSLRWCVLALATLPLASACAQDQGGAPPDDDDMAELPDQAKQLLEFGGSELAVVFAVDRDGKIKAYYNGKAKPGASVPFPRKKDDIGSTTSITIFQSKNPTTCWVNTLGYQQCVSW